MIQLLKIDVADYKNTGKATFVLPIMGHYSGSAGKIWLMGCLEMFQEAKNKVDVVELHLDVEVDLASKTSIHTWKLIICWQNGAFEAYPVSSVKPVESFPLP